MSGQSLRALLLFLGILAASTGLVRPPLMRAVALAMAEKGLDVRVSVAQTVPHGLLEGVHLHHLKVWCARAGESLPPLFTASRLRVESGLMGTLLHPARPDSVACDSFHLRLDFDHPGKLLTFLPRMEGQNPHRPRIRLNDWRLTLGQTGRKDFQVKGRECLLLPQDHGYRLSTEFTDPRYGPWRVDGFMESHPSRLRLTLVSDSARLHPDDLPDIPFIPKEVWQQVSLRGTARVRVDLDIQPEATHHHVTLDGEELDIGIPIAGIQAGRVSGQADVDGRVILLRNLRGSGWGGGLALPESRLDFDKPIPVLTFRAEGENLRLADLMRQPWAQGFNGLTRMANLVRGTASGQVEMAFTLHRPLPAVDINGSGEAGIRGGLQIHWKVKTEQGRVRFEPFFRAK